MGATLSRGEAQNLLTFIENIGKLLVSIHTDRLFKFWPQSRADMNSSQLTGRLIFGFNLNRPSTAYSFTIDQVSHFEIVLLDTDTEPETQFSHVYCYRIISDNRVITWKLATRYNATMLIRHLVEHNQELHQQLTNAFIATDDLAPSQPELQPEPP